ncbi:DegT/DnrJ/EryC1/StrS family aminotransferase [endosymbiont of Lamellibrachia barhami]|uniref:DegT/DnrJ/EryC1/StrS family aminotransferase n=1 Tax=endosymbiont of Lamellibrachia barhami TaxID=205975 RepID=UPI0015B17418|nr:DegT/DnrJ/EryC1/StrS aminotransferase family protein [endosymbiont of Lamellibrachia barhami]
MLPFTRPTIGEEEQQAIKEVLASGWITTGPKVKAFEVALEAYIGGGVLVRAFNSGTSALEAALIASGVGSGDEVILPAMSFTASANVIVRVGAIPVFVDVDLVSRNLTVKAVEAALTPRTRAIMPVHFAGLAVEMHAIYDLAERNNLVVVEDAAQAIGTGIGGHKVGASGNPVCFSFHPNKNITTIEGGALASSDPQFIRRVERIRFHGIERDDAGGIDVPEWGGKMNMPDVGAAMGLVQLPKLEGFNHRRRELALRYIERLPKHSAMVISKDVPGHSWHMFAVCIDFLSLGTSRKAFQEQLQAMGVGTGIHYPAMHLFSLYRHYGYGPGDFPVAERIGEQTLTLPLFPAMADEDVDQVCDALNKLLLSGEVTP